MAATALTPEEKNFAHLLAIAAVESARKRSPKNVRPHHVSPTHFRPSYGWVADPIPFYWNG